MAYKKIFLKIIVLISFIVSCFIYFINTTKVNATAPIAWFEDGMTRVFKTDPEKLNPAFYLYSAKNEYEPFQIVVKAPAGINLTNVNVTVSDLADQYGNIISANNIQLYREHYLNVTAGSRVWTGQTNPPLGPGWYPDALIPFKDPATGLDLTGTLDAVPFNVLAGENQPVWADVYVPAGTQSGIYNGTVEVTSDQGSSILYITLNVWNFTLPQTRSLKGQGQLIWNSPYNNLSAQIELIKHRMNPKEVNNSNERLLIDQHGFDRRHVFYDTGTTYNNCNSLPPPLPSDVAAEAAMHEPDLYLFDSYANEVWMCTSLFPTFLEWAQNLRAGGVHPEIVSYPVDGLMGPDLDHTAADVWYILPKHYDLAVTNINTLINHPGTQVMSYNPLVQEGYSPKYTIDFPPVSARIMHGFINQSLGLKGTKFWRVNNWKADPWNDPNIVSGSGVPAPGEGAMVYPGDDVGLFNNQFVSGVRMKWFREGSEDYEYVEILKNLGYEQFALDTARAVGSDFHNWSKNKDVLLGARWELGNQIDQIYSPAPTIIPSVTSIPTITPVPTFTPSPTITPTPTLPPPNPTPSVMAISPLADTYVSSTSPTNNFGTNKSIKIDGVPVKIAYFKFNLGPLAGRTILSANLRLRISSSSKDVQYLKTVSDTAWSETLMNYVNRPLPGSVITSFPGGSSGTWKDVPITSYVDSNKGLTVSFVIDATGGDGMDAYAKESTQNKPQIIVNYQ